MVLRDSTMEGLAASATVKGHWTIQPRWEGATVGLRSWLQELRELSDSLLRWKGRLFVNSLRRGAQSWQQKAG